MSPYDQADFIIWCYVRFLAFFCVFCRFSIRWIVFLERQDFWRKIPNFVLLFWQKWFSMERLRRGMRLIRRCGSVWRPRRTSSTHRHTEKIKIESILYLILTLRILGNCKVRLHLVNELWKIFLRFWSGLKFSVFTFKFRFVFQFIYS